MSLWPTLLLLSRTRNASLAILGSVRPVSHSTLGSTTNVMSTASRPPTSGRLPVFHRPIQLEGEDGSSSR